MARPGAPAGLAAASRPLLPNRRSPGREAGWGRGPELLALEDTLRPATSRGTDSTARLSDPATG